MLCIQWPSVSPSRFDGIYLCWSDVGTNKVHGYVSLRNGWRLLPTFKNWTSRLNEILDLNIIFDVISWTCSLVIKRIYRSIPGLWGLNMLLPPKEIMKMFTSESTAAVWNSLNRKDEVENLFWKLVDRICRHKILPPYQKSINCYLLVAGRIEQILGSLGFSADSTISFIFSILCWYYAISLYYSSSVDNK